MELSEAHDEAADTAPVDSYRVHWTVFLPTVVIAALYGGLWLWFTEVQGASGGVSRAAILVVAVGVPLLLVHAGLRFVNGRLELGADELVARPGWPVRRERHVTYSHVVDLRLRRGLIGRLVDVGSLIVVDHNGDRTVMPDLAEPARVMAAVSKRLQSPQPSD